MAGIQKRFLHSFHSPLSARTFHFRQSPFSTIETELYRVVGCDFRRFPLSCGWLS